MLKRIQETSKTNPVYFDTKKGEVVRLNKVKGSGHGKLPREAYGYLKSR